MSTPESSEVLVFQILPQSLGRRLNIAGVGTAAAKIPKKVLDELQEILNLRLSQEATSFHQNEENVAGRGYRPGGHGVEQSGPPTSVRESSF
jgi:hypothetical protein